MFAWTSHMYFHTASFSFQSTMQNQSYSTPRITICFFHCPHRRWHSWLLGHSRETEAETVKRWLSLHLQLLTRLTTTSLHTLPWTLRAHTDTPLVRYSSGHVLVPAAWQLHDGLMWKEKLYVDFHPSHLEHLRRCSESLAWCNWCVAGARENYWKGNFVTISHDDFKKKHAIHGKLVRKGKDIITLLAYMRYSINIWTVYNWTCLASKQALWHSCLISPNKTLPVVFVQLIGHWHLACWWQQLWKKSTLIVVLCLDPTYVVL